MTRKLIPFLLLFLLSLQPAGLHAQRIQAEERVLPNGLKVILAEDRRARLVTFQVWYRVGSRNEAWGKTGLSHLLEHMMFKGTSRIAPETFSRLIQENGGNYNAFTSEDFTAYFENMSADRISIPIEIEADRMKNLVLREDDFGTERMVVMEERRLRTEDNPKALLMEQLQAAAFHVHPYHWPVIGWMQDLQRITLEDLKNYYHRYYHPANAFLLVAGDFQKDELLPALERTFGAIPPGPVPEQERDVDPPRSANERSG